MDYKTYEGMSLVGLIKEMGDVKEQLDKVTEEKTALQKTYDYLRINLIPELMADDDLSTITVDGVGRVSLTADIYSSVPSEKKEAAYEWLREHQLGDIIKETINSGTLKATIKALMKKGEEVPGDIFKVTPYTRASITKVK